MHSVLQQSWAFQADEVIVASTGVIGQVLPIEPIRDTHVQELAQRTCSGRLLWNSSQRHHDNRYLCQRNRPRCLLLLDGKTCTVGGMAKGSGMIHPNMATTLNFVTTDAAISYGSDPESTYLRS